MAQEEDFVELIQRVRRGDSEAAEELWRQYEPLLQREMRLCLRDPRLRQRFDEYDVCQSVMASFFVRIKTGQFELSRPEQLNGLLARMGRNKLASQTRRHAAERRDYRRTDPFPEDPCGHLVDSETTPSQVVSWRELYQRFCERLSDDERQMADLRAENKQWSEIAKTLGGTPDSRRMQLNRAVERISRELGLAALEET